MKYWILIALFIIPLLSVAWFYVLNNHSTDESCPESCSCTLEGTDWGPAVNVQCGERNLESVPIKTNDQPVSVFDLSSNVLKTLEEDALSSFGSVRYLYLQHNKIVNISEKAFQRLENLTVINLASNRLISVSPNLFNGNQKLDKLILRNNNLATLQWNTPILNGPSSLSFLDLQSCKLSNISSITFSLLLNLTFLDISRNSLVLLKNDTLSSHEKLKDVNLENNHWECGAVFHGLMCWIHSKLTLSYNRTVKCNYLNGTSVIWSPKNLSSLCDSESTLSVTMSNGLDMSTSTTLNLVSTPSHELDMSTSKTLNMASTPSNDLDISTEKTPNPNVSHKAEPGFNSALSFFGKILGVLLAFVFPYFLFIIYKKCRTQPRRREPLLSNSENDTVENEVVNSLSGGVGVNLLRENITRDSE